METKVPSRATYVVLVWCVVDSDWRMTTGKGRVGRCAKVKVDTVRANRLHVDNDVLYLGCVIVGRFFGRGFLICQL